MNHNYPEENTLRQYLLGRLDDQEEVETNLSMQILVSDELSEIVDSIEDDIIEEYLNGTLNPADKRDVEEYFLRSPERKDKLQFASLLRSSYETTPVSGDGGNQTKPDSGPIIVVP